MSGAGVRASVDTACCVQVYNENVFDLLTDQPSPKPLPIHETDEEGVFVEGLAEFLVASPRDCLAILARGEQNRAVRETYMNQNSSRSHSIFQLQVSAMLVTLLMSPA